MVEVQSLRARLVREATEVLAREGVPGLTVRRVAEAAGCSTIGIYTHFGGKQGLVEAAVLDAFTDFEAAVAVVDTLPAGRAQLAAGAHAYRDWALANRSRYLVMFAPGMADFTPGDEAVERITRSLRAHTRRVAGAMAAGDVRIGGMDGSAADGTAADGTAEDLAYHLWACVHGHVMLDLFYGRGADDEPARRAFDAAVGRMLDGIAAPASPRAGAATGRPPR
jgi:AcrR family transcriptional regulator